MLCYFFFSSRRRHTRCSRDWSSDVCSSDLGTISRDDELLSKLTVSFSNVCLQDPEVLFRFGQLGDRHGVVVVQQQVIHPDEPEEYRGLGPGGVSIEHVLTQGMVVDERQVVLSRQGGGQPYAAPWESIGHPGEHGGSEMMHLVHNNASIYFA